jgi:hypothetical protein
LDLDSAMHSQTVSRNCEMDCDGESNCHNAGAVATCLQAPLGDERRCIPMCLSGAGNDREHGGGQAATPLKSEEPLWLMAPFFTK